MKTVMFPIPRNAGSLPRCRTSSCCILRRALQLMQCQDCPTELVCDEEQAWYPGALLNARVRKVDSSQKQRGQLGSSENDWMGMMPLEGDALKGWLWVADGPRGRDHLGSHSSP